MKLLRAEFQNFRLLRDLTLEFSTDLVKKLTVFRAANETGKTTLLTALQWGLFGDQALPSDGAKNYRLHPISWDFDSSPYVEIRVYIDYETVSFWRGIEERRQYRICRMAQEERAQDGTIRRKGADRVMLFELQGAGVEEIPAPESVIRDELPEELREVFFTDGDRALSFVEAKEGERQKRVKNAIRSLLGISAIESAQEHINKAAQQAKKICDANRYDRTALAS